MPYDGGFKVNPGVLSDGSLPVVRKSSKKMDRNKADLKNNKIASASKFNNVDQNVIPEIRRMNFCNQLEECPTDTVTDACTNTRRSSFPIVHHKALYMDPKLSLFASISGCSGVSDAKCLSCAKIDQLVGTVMVSIKEETSMDIHCDADAETHISCQEIDKIVDHIQRTK